MKLKYTPNYIFALFFFLTTSILNAGNYIDSKELSYNSQACTISIACPPEQTEVAGPDCTFLIPDYSGLANVTDECAPPIITQSPLPGTVVGIGAHVITLLANDGTNSDSCNFNILIVDTTSPSLSCPLPQVEAFDENCQFLIPDYTTLASATDTCSMGNIIITQTPLPGTVIFGNTTIFLFATDAAGNIGVCNFQVIASDVHPPTIECPADKIESAIINCEFVIPDYTDLADANDNCGPLSLTQIPAPGTIVGLGSTQIFLTASDGVNQSSCNFNITVVDDTPPILSCPADQLEDFDANCELVLQDYTSQATAIDNCDAGPFTFTQIPPAGSVISGDTTITIFGEDNEGNVGLCTFQINVNDVVAPTISCPSTIIMEEVNENNCMFSLPDYSGFAVAMDNCNPVSVTQDPAIGSLVGLGTSTVTLIASDGTNTASCTFDILVEDTGMPSAICAFPFGVDLDASGVATITPDDVNGWSSDYCGIASMSIDVSTFTCANQGANTVTLTVEDNFGNTSTCSTIVFVNDPLFVCNEPPVAECQTLVVTANDNCQGEATAADFDAGSYDPDGMPFTISINPEGPYGIGDTIVTLTIDDGDFTDSCTTTITVQDGTPPVMSCLNDQFEDALTDCTFVVPDYRLDIMASDNCGGSLMVTQNPVPGTIVMAGITAIDIVATDGINETSCSFNLTVEDNQSPTAICQNITVQLDENGTVVIEPIDVDGGSFDNCEIVSMEIDNNTFTCSDLGVNTILFTVTDSAGFTSQCNATITVEDTTAPEVFCQNITVILDSNNQAQITLEDILVGSSDNCSVESIALDITDFDCSSVGENVVTLTATDIEGNQGSCTAIVTVQDTVLPIVVCQNITVQLDENGIATIVPSDLDGGSSDNCPDFSFSVDIDTFNCSHIGVNEVLFTVTDVQGNNVSCNAIVTVEDVTPPVLTCQDITIILDSEYTATIEVSDVLADATDNCTIQSAEIDFDTFDCSNIGENEVTVVVTDQSGNESTCIAMVTIEEGVFQPNAVCQNLTVIIHEDGTATVAAENFDAGSSGMRCFDPFTIDRDSFTCEDIGEPIQIEFTVFNSAGQTDTCTAFVNVVDNLAPELTCPEDQSVTSPGPYILPDYFATGAAVAEDNCSTTLITSQEPSPGTPMEEGEHTIILVVQDISGFEDECEFTLIVEYSLGIESPDAALETIMMHPNPANQVINISNQQFVEVEKIAIYDINGRIVKQLLVSEISSLFTIDISNLQSAIYLVVIENKNGQVIKQLVKE